MLTVNFYIFTALSLILCLGLMPLVILFCKKMSLYDSVNARKIHSGNIPRLGGFAIVISFLISIAFCFIFEEIFSIKVMWPLVAAGALIFVFGLLDDILELRAIFKLLVQMVATAILVINDFRFHRIFGIEIPVAVSFVITYFWILGIINAYNLIDGLDGLCGVLSLTALLTYAFLFYNSGYIAGTYMSMMLAASVVGFLVFNWPPAKIFMGDGGSQFLGFMIATLPLFKTGNEQFEFNKFLVMLVIVSFPMLDTIAAIWRRLRDHRPIMSPDRFHLHHKLLNIGFTKTHALYFVFIIQIFICFIVILSSRLVSQFHSILLLGIAYLFMIGFFSVIHYINRAVLRRATKEATIRNSGKAPDYNEETKGSVRGPKQTAVVIEDDESEEAVKAEEDSQEK